MGKRTVEAIGFGFKEFTLFDLTKFAEKRGLTLHPLEDGNLIEVMLFKDGKYIKSSKKKYTNWQAGQYEVLTKIYDQLWKKK